MYLQKVTRNKCKSRALELVMKVGNVMEGLRSGIISTSEVSEILFDIAEKNRDLILHEHEDPETKEAVRRVRVTLLPFSDKLFTI